VHTTGGLWTKQKGERPVGRYSICLRHRVVSRRVIFPRSIFLLRPVFRSLDKVRSVGRSLFARELGRRGGATSGDAFVAIDQ